MFAAACSAASDGPVVVAQRAPASGTAATTTITTGEGEPASPSPASAATRPPRQTGHDAATTTTLPATTTTRPPALTYGDEVGRPWGTAVQGLLTFRGNPSRTYHGAGPVPEAPQVAWRYPDRAMCGESSEYGETKVWCGTGWVGQPAVFERGGRTWLVFGAYDYNFHFVDAATGQAILPPFPTGDIAKGTVTVDPDGFPLVYGGSRDNKLRVLAIDRARAGRAVGAQLDGRRPPAAPVEQRLGRRAAHRRRLPRDRRREQPLPRREAQPRTDRTASCRSRRSSCSPRRPGTTSC